jgi:hypothetical protein
LNCFEINYTAPDDFVGIEVHLAPRGDDERNRDKDRPVDWARQLEMLLSRRNKWSPGHSTFPLLNVAEFDWAETGNVRKERLPVVRTSFGCSVERFDRRREREEAGPN